MTLPNTKVLNTQTVFQHAVFGAPIQQSLSPRIHAAFGKQCGIALNYRAIEAQSEQFADALAAFANIGGFGANVTSPLKAQAFALCATVDAFAERAGAVNTLTRANNAWHGANTDGIGLVRDLSTRQCLQLQGRRMLLLGAGGAARGVIAPLQQAGIGEIVICNRTLSSAGALASAFANNERGLFVQGCALQDLPNLGAFDLIVHATSAGHRSDAFPDWPESIARSGTVLVDLSYGAAARPALSWASEQEIVGVDGLGMLLEQAAEAFFLWHGVRPDTAPIWGELRALV